MSSMASQITSLKIVYLTTFFRHRSNKTSKLRVTGLCDGNSPVTGEFLERASDAEMSPFHDVIMHGLNDFFWRLIFGDANIPHFVVSFLLETLQWRHNDHDCVSNHQPRGCLLNRLFRRRSKKTSKLRVTGLRVGNSPGPVNSPHKGPVTRKMFPFDDVIIMRWRFHINDEGTSYNY